VAGYVSSPLSTFLLSQLIEVIGLIGVIGFLVKNLFLDTLDLRGVGFLSSESP
jgi:flagellar biogenesis protein FliO